MELKNRTIITENNFIGTVTHLKNDMFLYHRKNEEQFKSQNWVDYCLAVEFDGKLYDCQTRAVTQYNDNYDFKNAVDEANKILATLHTALSAKQEPCEVCKEVKNLWGSPNIDINGYDYCPYCGRKLEESNGI